MIKKILFSIGLIASISSAAHASIGRILSTAQNGYSIFHHVDPSAPCEKTETDLTISYSQSQFSFHHNRLITIFARINKTNGKISCFYELNDDPHAPTPVAFGPATRQDLPEKTFHDFENIYNSTLELE